MSTSSFSPLSTAARLRQEIGELRQLIDKIESRSTGESGNRWYLQMLNQSVARKSAALEYIRTREASLATNSLDRQNIRNSRSS